MGRYIPVDVIIATILASKNSEIEYLKKKLNNMETGFTDNEISKRDGLAIQQKSDNQHNEIEEMLSKRLGSASSSSQDIVGEVERRDKEETEVFIAEKAEDENENIDEMVIQAENCWNEIKNLENEIYKLIETSSPPKQEAEIMFKELNVLKRYCEKMFLMHEENEQLKAKAALIDELEEESKLLKEQNSRLQKQIKECCDEIDEGQENAFKLEEENKSISNQIADQAEERERLEKEVCELKCKLQCAECQLNELTVHHEEVVRDNKCLKSKLYILQRQMKNMSANSHIEEKLKHHEEIVQERNCLRARICQLEKDLVKGGKMKEVETYCSQLIEKVKHHEEIVHDRNCLRAKVTQLEDELQYYEDLPEKHESFKESTCNVDDNENDRQNGQAQLARLRELEREVKTLRKTSKKAACLQECLQKCQQELKTLKCSSANMQLEMDQTQGIMTDLKKERDFLRCHTNTDTLEEDYQKVIEERDCLKRKVDELSELESDFLELLDKTRCFATIRAERNKYKAKYEEMIGIETETEVLKQDLELARKMLDDREQLIVQLKQCECCIQDQEAEIKTLVNQIEASAQEQEKMQNNIDCLSLELAEKNEIIKLSENQLEYLRDQLGCATDELSKEKDCKNKAECEILCIKKKALEAVEIAEALKNKEENCKEEQNKLKNELKQYLQSCKLAYEKIQELEVRLESIEKIKQNLQNENCEQKKLYQDLLCKSRNFKSENDALKKELKLQDEEMKRTICEAKENEESVTKVKKFLIQKDELCRCIFEKLKEKICCLRKENDDLRKVAEEVAGASGDQHLRDLIEASFATVEKLKEELTTQYQEWDNLKD